MRLRGGGRDGVRRRPRPRAAAAVADEVGGSCVRSRHGRRRPTSTRRSPRAVDAFGGVDIAFLNAGIAIGVADLAALTDDDYYRIMRVNVDGVVFGLAGRDPRDGARGGGAIVATSRSPG